MKKVLAIWMLSVLFLPGAVRLSMVLEFTINQDYIAKVLCINRDKPITVCHGVCYLNDQLEKTEQNDQDESLPFYRQLIQLSVFVAPQLFETRNYIHYKEVNEPFIQRCNLFGRLHTKVVDRPPENA